MELKPLCMCVRFIVVLAGMQIALASNARSSSAEKDSISVKTVIPSPASKPEGEIFHVYPDPAVSNESIPLYFALMQSFSGGYVSAGGLPGILVALDEINSNPYALPGYTLHYTLSDNECTRYRSQRTLFNQLRDDRTKIAAVGSGCTLATEPAAEISHFWNIPQISCHASSPTLRNRERFRRYFQTIGSEENQGYADFGVIKFYGWKKITILQLDIDSFEIVTNELSRLLRKQGVHVSIKTFEQEDRSAGLDSPFDNDTRIYAFIMYSEFARELLCEAYEKNLMYPRSTFLHPAWWVGEWWKDPPNSTENLTCSEEQRAQVVDRSIAVLLHEYIEDDADVAETGTNGTIFRKKFEEHYAGNEKVLGAVNAFGQDCYDAIWILALALNKTMNDLRLNLSLNEKAALKANINTTFALEHTTYENDGVLKQLLKHINETNFLGITGRIKFDEDGIRAGRRLFIYQNRKESGTTLEQMLIAKVSGSDFEFAYFGNATNESVWPVGVPYDGIPRIEITTVRVPVTSTFIVLSTGGLVFCLICIGFNFIFRKKKLIRLTSPNLNYIILAGAALLYVDIYFFVIPKENQLLAKISCKITPWLTSLGYSLCFGTVLAKMTRVFFIFNNPSLSKKSILIKDGSLALFVVFLVAVDLIVLVAFTITEEINGNLTFELRNDVENPSGTVKDPNGIYYELILENYSYICFSNTRNIILAVLYGYKAVLQVLTVLLALKTRKVKVKGLDDYKYIIMATYVSTFVLVVVTVFTFTIEDQVNLYAALTSFSFFLGSTVIVMLIFVPKMVTLYRDPSGDKVFSKTMPTCTQDDHKESEKRKQQASSTGTAP